MTQEELKERCHDLVKLTQNLRREIYYMEDIETMTDKQLDMIDTMIDATYDFEEMIGKMIRG